MRRLRPPISGEGVDETIPLECPKGSIMFWNAATWHGASSRTIPGLRVGFHTPCKQVWLRPLESYTDLSDEIVSRNPPVLGRMIGREDVFGKQTPTATAPAETFRRMAEWSRQRRY
jgi:ectoine hydroxylase-related dioxygenase (phytanoyl-CoA dioxygenase family)